MRPRLPFPPPFGRPTRAQRTAAAASKDWLPAGTRDSNRNRFGDGKQGITWAYMGVNGKSPHRLHRAPLSDSSSDATGLYPLLGLTNGYWTPSRNARTGAAALELPARKSLQ